MLDLSATKWMVREISRRRDAAREFIIAYQDRLMWGSDQVSYDGRGFDFLASRWWCHRKLWETAYVGESPIADPDVADGRYEEVTEPAERGAALRLLAATEPAVVSAADDAPGVVFRLRLTAKTGRFVGRVGWD